MNFISCVKWVKQGVSKSVPDKININEEELRQMINDAKNEVASNATEQPNLQAAVSDDEFDFEHYDNEDCTLKANIQDVVIFDNESKKKKKATKKERQRLGDESDSEDEKIREDDNLILVGHVDDDFNLMNVYLYNENDGDMYVHHDIILKSAPLCVEWLTASNVGDNNLCAIGEMDPVIGIWDLDIVNCVEPIFKLGRAKKKKTNKNHGHTDAVLSLTWNSELPHILCTGSVDKRGLLWDLHSCQVATELTVFTDKVQTMLWNPHDPYSLLTGCADGYFRNFDCRVYDQFQKWNLNAGVECLLPHPENKNNCFVSTEDGIIHYLDYRQRKSIFSFQAHDKEVTGLSFYKNDTNVLISVSVDENMRFWDVNNEFELIFSKNPNLGSLCCINMNPNYPFLCCVGGSRQTRNKKILEVFNIDNILKPKECSHRTILHSSNTASESFDVPLLSRKSIKAESTDLVIPKKRKKKFKVSEKKNIKNCFKKSKKKRI